MTPQVYKSNLNLVLSILVNGTISFIKLGNLNNQLCLLGDLAADVMF